MPTITKKELVARISQQSGQTKVVTKDILQRFLDEIIVELAKGNRLEFREFGVFELKSRPARRAQNPRTLEKVDVPARRVVKFKVGRLMRQWSSRSARRSPSRLATAGNSPALRPPRRSFGPLCVPRLPSLI